MDFGLSKHIIINGKHIQEESKAGFVGNAIFASTRSYLRLTQSRKDDM